MMNTGKYYYHAGVSIERQDDWPAVEWSSHTRRTFAAAQTEARRMAREYGGIAIVEQWDRAHGLHPGAGAVDDSETKAERILRIGMKTQNDVTETATCRDCGKEFDFSVLTPMVDTGKWDAERGEFGEDDDYLLCQSCMDDREEARNR